MADEDEESSPPVVNIPGLVRPPARPAISLSTLSLSNNWYAKPPKGPLCCAVHRLQRHAPALAALTLSRLAFVQRASVLGASRLVRGGATTTMSDPPTFDPSKYFTAAPPEATKGYIMQQSMIRVKDPEASLKFYCEGHMYKPVKVTRVLPRFGRRTGGSIVTAASRLGRWAAGAIEACRSASLRPSSRWRTALS